MSDMTDPRPAEPVIAAPDESLAAAPVDATPDAPEEVVESEANGEDTLEEDTLPDHENGGGK